MSLEDTGCSGSIFKSEVEPVDQGLCWKCEEEVRGLPTFTRIFPWTHCHHSPKEKPKCWCERGYVKFMNEFGRYDEAKFCPNCGKKL